MSATGHPSILLRLPPAVLEEVRQRAGPSVAGKPSGAAEWVRQLVLRELDMEAEDADERHRKASTRPGVVYGVGARAKRRARA
jgi:hypothetical protein